MDKSRFSFHIRPGLNKTGDRLVWRFPVANREVARQLAPVVQAAGGKPPKQITVGYYFLRDDPPVWSFMPLTTPLAIAALSVEAVQRRICEDLAQYAISDREQSDG